MREFEIRLHSVDDVLAFVALATRQSFPVYVSCHGHRVDGKSFMELFCLDLNRPLMASVECTQSQFEVFETEVKPFLAN